MLVRTPALLYVYAAVAVKVIIARRQGLDISVIIAVINIYPLRILRTKTVCIINIWGCAEFLPIPVITLMIFLPDLVAMLAKKNIIKLKLSCFRTDWKEIKLRKWRLLMHVSFTCNMSFSGMLLFCCPEDKLICF